MPLRYLRPLRDLQVRDSTELKWTAFGIPLMKLISLLSANSISAAFLPQVLKVFVQCHTRSAYDLRVRINRRFDIELLIHLYFYNMVCHFIAFK